MIKKIVLLLTFIILLLILNLNNNKEYLVNQDKWKNYRLGDIISGYIFRAERDNYDKYSSRYPDSIATKYANQIYNLEDKKKFYNIKILNDICQEKIKENKNFKLPEANDLVIHIRCGDAILTYENGKYFFIDTRFNIQPENYDKLIKEKLLTTDKINNVYILYGIHNNYGEEKKKLSLQYIEDIKKIFEKNKFQVIDKHSTNPDNDFLFLSSANYFIQEGGGLSQVIAKVVKYNNGTVYEVF